MLKLLSRVAASGLVVAAFSAQAVQASDGGGQSSLAAVRAATASFHSTDAAVHAGYGPFLPCFDLPGVGGMGQHYVNGLLVDASVDPKQPEALVYEVDGSRLQLVAVEYIVPWSAWVSPEPPQLFGQTYYRNTSLHIWALHAWIWRPNPLGMFANYNPNVNLCPGH